MKAQKKLLQLSPENWRSVQVYIDSHRPEFQASISTAATLGYKCGLNEVRAEIVPLEQTLEEKDENLAELREEIKAKAEDIASADLQYQQVCANYADLKNQFTLAQQNWNDMEENFNDRWQEKLHVISELQQKISRFKSDLTAGELQLKREQELNLRIAEEKDKAFAQVVELQDKLAKLSEGAV